MDERLVHSVGPLVGTDTVDERPSLAFDVSLVVGEWELDDAMGAGAGG